MLVQSELRLLARAQLEEEGDAAAAAWRMRTQGACADTSVFQSQTLPLSLKWV